MKIHSSRILAMAIAFVITVIWAGAGMPANAQYLNLTAYPATPPQGPAPPSGTTSPSLSVDDTLSLIVYAKVDQVVDDNNTCYWPTKLGAPSCFRPQGGDDNDRCIWGCYKNGVWVSRPDSSGGALISTSKKRYSPWMYATQYSDRPNQNVALTTYNVTYTLSNIYGCAGSFCADYPASRTLYQSIEVYISCEGYYTGTGVMTSTTVIEKPVLDTDHSWLEDVIGGIAFNNLIPNLVDSEISSALGAVGRTVISPVKDLFGNTIHCNRLGVTADPTAQKFDQINYDNVRPRILTSLVPQITVRVIAVKRLWLHDLYGGIVHYAVEYPKLELYAGYSKLIVSLPQMVEGQIFYPGSSAVVSTPVPSSTSQLVLISNMRDNNYNTLDSSFVVFDKNTNFGNGGQTVFTPKTYWFRDPKLLKPTLIYGKGYEVTLQISSPTVTSVF
jgi:hypothetical protein